MPYLTEIVVMSIVGDDLANTRIIRRMGGQGEWMNVS
jgi:hypothetical protein